MFDVKNEFVMVWGNNSSYFIIKLLKHFDLFTPDFFLSSRIELGDFVNDEWVNKEIKKVLKCISDVEISYVINNGLFLEWDIIDNELKYLRIGELKNNRKQTLLESTKHGYPKSNDRTDISNYELCDYHSSVKLTIEDMTELFVRYDILSFDAMIYINSLIIDNFLEYENINEQFHNVLKSNIYYGFMNIWYSEHNDRFVQWEHDWNKVYMFKMGKLYNDTKLTIISSDIREPVIEEFDF